MKIPALKELGQRIQSLDSVWGFLKDDMTTNLRELVTVLRKLDLNNNFDSFEVEVTIPAGEELAIENKLRNGAIPSKRLIVRSNIAEITDGDTEWTVTHVTLKNTHATDSATLTVVFLK